MADEKNGNEESQAASAEKAETKPTPARKRKPAPKSVKDFKSATALEGNSRSGANLIVGGRPWGKDTTEIECAGLSDEQLAAMFDHPDLDVRVLR